MNQEEIDQEEYEDYIDHLEEKHRELLEEIKSTDWLDIFPEVVPLLPKILEERKGIKELIQQSIKRKMSKARVLDPSSRIVARWQILIKEFPVLEKISSDIWRIHCQIARTAPRQRDSTSRNVTHEEIELAKNVPITSLLSGKVKKSGKRYMTLCPLHTEDTPSFVIYPNNRFHCFGCNESGDSITLARKLYGLDFIDAVKRLLTN